MVSTDTIQMLLRQRQELREALLELRKEIATLDASSLNLVNRNIRNQPADRTPAPTAAPAPAVAAETQKTAPAAPEPKPVTAPPPPAPEKTAEKAAEAPPVRKEPVLAPPPEPKPAPELEAPTAAQHPTPPAAESHEETAKEETAKEEAKHAETKQAETKAAPHDDPATHHAASHHAAPDHTAPHDAASHDVAPHDDLEAMAGKARRLSAYLLDHPSNVPSADLGALDAAIAASGAAATPAGKAASHHRLQEAYRKVAGASFAGTGINGTTLEDSAAGAPLLWTIPFAISILVIVLFPLLLLARHLAGQMFTQQFAADITWSAGLMAAFLWGTVGALTLLALNIAVALRRRRFEAGVRTSPGLRGALGGVTGAVFFLLLETWLPMTSAAADFALDMVAFAGGLLSALLFAGLQRIVSAAVGLLEPKAPKPAVSPPAKK